MLGPNLSMRGAKWAMRDISVLALTATATNLALFGATIYLVGWRSWSPWWFLLVGVLWTSVETAKAAK
jgi:hypothetical protein